MKYPNKYLRLKYMFLIFSISYNDFFIGCLMVFTSVLFSQLNKPSSSLVLNASQASWIASVPSLTGPLGLLIIGILTDKIGRKKALQISFIPIIVSFVILAYSNTYRGILIGRTVGGLIFGSGACKFVYVSEVCTPDRRQLFFSVMFTFVGIGMVTACTLAMYLHWQTVSMILAVMSTVGLTLLLVLPESPTWLRSRGRVPEAERAEQWFGLSSPEAPATPTDDGADRNGEDGDHNGTTVVADPEDASGPSLAACWSLYARRNVWLPTLITLAFVACQEASGLFVVLFYSANLLRDFKVQWDDDSAFITLLSVSRILGSVTFTVMHSIKRKTMAATSFAGMAVSLAVVVTYVKIFPCAERPYGDLVLTAGFVSYMFFTLLGVVPLPWTLASEVFPSEVSGVMNGVVQTISFLMMFAVTKSYPSMVAYLGVENVWLIFTVFCMTGVLYSVFILPETQGVPIKDILARFESPKKNVKNDLP